VAKEMKLKLELKKPEIKILKEENVAYVRVAPLPPYPLKVTECGDHLMVHIDDKKNKVVGFTILHLSTFLKELEEKQHLKERAEEEVHRTVANIRALLPYYLPYYIFSHLSFSVNIRR